jgi:hypothetical protein
MQSRTFGAIAAITIATVSPASASVTISFAATANMSCTSGVCTPTAKTATLSVSDLASMLASGNVNVNTGSGKLAKKVEDIIVSDGFSWASAHSLTLDAYRSITVNKGIAVAGSGAVTLMTNDGGKNGALVFGSKGSLSFLGTSNSLTINAKVYTLENSVAMLASAIAANASGRFALSASYNASGDGTYTASPIAPAFEGTFYGLGNTIQNLQINGAAKSANIGLFAQIGTSGSVNALRLTNASVNAAQGSQVGILAGENDGSISNVFVSGKATAAAGGGAAVGGLVGLNFGGTIARAASSAAVAVNTNSNNTFEFVGGLVAANYGVLTQSWATGSVTAASRSYMGGLVGTNEVGSIAGTIENCYATGAVADENDVGAIGGLIGVNDEGASGASSYSLGSPSGPVGSNIGGFVGDDTGSMSNSYWDTTTSGITSLSQGAGNVPNDPGITGETSAALKAGLPSGFDATVWAERPKINNGFPYLIANPPQ